MRVKVDDSEDPVGAVDGVLTYDTERAMRAAGVEERGTISLANNWTTSIFAFVIWFSEFALPLGFPSSGRSVLSLVGR